ncbi:sulfatase-like hydrolase/transferase [Pontiella sulfatireligans]|nr:sulfatase-like hydrolase/transferase [Pontiella sulfatireligans]
MIEATIKPMSAICALCALATTVFSAEAPRPNILVVMCDDLGYADVGFNGSTDIRTPRMDMLAKDGTVFTSAYVAHPFCGPSRMGLMSGRYPHAFGGAYNLPNHGQGIEEYNNEGVPVAETLIGTVLQNAGYYTGAIGKWHMGFTQPYHPNNRGFEEFFGFLGGGHNYFPDQYQPAYERQVQFGNKHINEYILPLEYNGKNVNETEYMTDAFTREACRFVKVASAKEKPFFLYLSYNAPHTPLEALEDDLVLYEDIEDPKRRTYAAMVHAVDRGVGQLVETLKSTEQFDNTLIVFLSDNGGKTAAGANNYPLRNGKGSAYEGGYRVPMFFHWPQQVPAGQKFDFPVSALDFYPTFAGLCGAAIPDGKILNGKDIWAAFKDGQNPRQGEMVFALRYRGGYSEVGARRDDWKATRGEASTWQLFNIKDDAGEAHDLSAQYPERLEEMVAAAKKWSLTHAEPRWFHEERAREIWDETRMPATAATFGMDSIAFKPADIKPVALEQKTTPLSNGDITKAQFLENEKRRCEVKGWKWNSGKVETMFNEIDANQDGIASGREKKIYWANYKAQ